VGLNKVAVFDDEQKTVRLLHPKACLDMGGMAKGYALDRAIRTARACGIRCALIDLGGNVGCLEEPPPGRRHYSVGVRDPLNPDELMGTVRITDCTVATSGNYESYQHLDGKRVHHIVDPRTGYPVPDVAGVTVITPLGIDSDVYSTAVFVAGEATVRKLRASRRRTSVLLVRLSAEGKPEVSRYGWAWEEYTE
jgi:thiamine biosynthesis lipoprotein